MQITDVRVRRIEREGRMKAIVSITLDNEFVVHDIKVIDGEKGLFIAMPSRRSTDGEYRDIAHPINSETRDMIQSIVLEKYQATASGLDEDGGLQGRLRVKSEFFFKDSGAFRFLPIWAEGHNREEPAFLKRL